MLPRIALLATLTLALGPVPAVAQRPGAAIVCKIGDHSIALDLFLPLAKDDSGTAAKTGLQGTLDVHHQRMAKDRRRWTLDGRQPTQLWNWGNEMKLRLLLGTGENLLDFVIDTQVRTGSDTHTGTFRLEAAEGVRVQGRIECTVG